MTSKNNLWTTLRTIFNGTEDLEFIMNSWKTKAHGVDDYYSEHIYLGSTNFNNLNPKVHWEGVFLFLKKYLIDGNILSDSYSDMLQGHSKAVWLSSEYLKNGKFNNPICSHWNPRRGDFEIHPGSSRTTILELFSPEAEVETYYFSTYGVKPSWAQHFRKLNYHKLLEKKREYDHCMEGWSIRFTADHGTLIPHITVDGGQTGANGARWHNKCRNILQTKKIWVNKDIDILKLFNKVEDTSDADKIIFIKKEELSIQDLLRLSILIFLDYDWDDSSFKLQINSDSNNIKH